MRDPFISIEYLVVALLKAKYEIFRESFVTMSELNQFRTLVQQELNHQNTGFAIVSKGISRDAFRV